MASDNDKEIRILLSEDSAIMRTIQLKTLNSLGYNEIIECEDGDIAIARLKADKNFDLVISDWNMPNKSGLDILLWMRSDAHYRDVPFIMATGQGDMKQEQKAVKAGVTSFIAKPFNADELKSKIDEALGKKIEAPAPEPVRERKPQKTASGKVKLKIAHIQITDHLVVGMLKNMIQKGELSPRYFELENMRMPGWNPVRQALQSGTVDAACVLAPIAMDLFNFGAPIKLTLFAHRNGSTFVRNRIGEYGEPFPRFFKGKSFFIPHQMSIHHMLSHIFFSGMGLRAGAVGEEDPDVTFEVVDPIKMPDFLRGNPDACGFMVAEPIGTKAIAGGIAELQFLSHELWENHPCCVVAMRDDFIGPCPDAVHEFSEMLVHAGKLIYEKPVRAAEVAVDFLDPDKKLGLKVPLLKNVLTEGLRTNNLYPSIRDLDIIQRYMHDKMGLGALVDLEKFVDTRFADAVCKDGVKDSRSNLNTSQDMIQTILRRGIDVETKKTDKTMLNKEGKYLTFKLADQEFGIDILKIKEIIGIMPIREVPQAPPFIKGVINLRDKVIPVTDLRLKFGMNEMAYTDRNCIIILEFELNDGVFYMGIAVDSVMEVLDIRASEIEETPKFGFNINTSHILAIAKTEGGVKILLDIDNILNFKDKEEMDVLL